MLWSPDRNSARKCDRVNAVDQSDNFSGSSLAQGFSGISGRTTSRSSGPLEVDSPQLFNLEKDPYEMRDLAGDTNQPCYELRHKELRHFPI